MSSAVTIEGPLPRVTAADLGDLFIEDEWGRAHYVSQRSDLSPPTLRVYHIMLKEYPVGFLSSLVTVEEDEEGCEVRLFFALERVYVKKDFRRRGLSTVALAPLLHEVDLTVRAMAKKWPNVRVHVGGPAVSYEGERLVATYQRLAAPSIRGLRNVTLMWEEGARRAALGEF